MAFQPIVDARTGALFGVEALMRTKEPSMPNPGACSRRRRRSIACRSSDAEYARSRARRSRRAPTIVALFVNLHPEDLSTPICSTPTHG